MAIQAAGSDTNELSMVFSLWRVSNAFSTLLLFYFCWGIYDTTEYLSKKCLRTDIIRGGGRSDKKLGGGLNVGVPKYADSEYDIPIGGLLPQIAIGTGSEFFFYLQFS